MKINKQNKVGKNASVHVAGTEMASDFKINLTKNNPPLTKIPTPQNTSGGI